MTPVVRRCATLALTLGALLAPPAVFAVDTGDIVVVSLKGEVHVTMNRVLRTVRAGSVLEPPATLHTGRDGAVELRQGSTTLSVGPETMLEFPALERRGAPIDRILQPRGNVFYNIGKREGRKLRIETPFLVGVVKGTQFNVAAQDQATTISLFEGLLEVRAADDSSVVDLKAGEIASRQRDDQAINVLKMGAGREAPSSPRQSAGSASTGNLPKPTQSRAVPQHQDRDSMLVDRGVAETVNSPAGTVGVGANVSNAEAPVVESGVEVAAPRVDAVPASVDTGAAVSVSVPAVDVSTPLGVDAGPASVDTGAAVSVSSPVVDVPTSTIVDAGPLVDVGVTTGTDVSTSVDTSTTAAVAAGPLTTDLGVDTELGLESGETRFTVINGSSRNQVEVTVGSERAAEAVADNNGHGNAAPSLDLGADLGVDLGVDLGLDEAATTPATDTTDKDKPGNGPPQDVLDRLDGLVRRPGKK